MTAGRARPWRRTAVGPRVAAERRRGPEGEAPWWDPLDQAWAEDLALPLRTFGRGWLEVPMLNNAERPDPLAGPAAGGVLAARAERGLVALDEGRAWRRRRDGVLAVLRVEVYASVDDAAHRAAWREDAEAALAQTWRARWAERGRYPGWVEASWVPLEDRPEAVRSGPLASAVDWLRVEDHTEAAEQEAVMVYEHVVVWLGRAQATLTVRHVGGLDLDQPVGEAAAVLAATPPPPDRPAGT